MPTKKQRRRALKERRHEYETVWVDGEGNELEEPPEEAAAAPEKRDRPKSDGAKPKPRAKTTQQRGGRPVRVPPPPSWRRATKRALIFGVVIFAVFAILGSKNGHHNYAAAFIFGAVYTLIFIPFTYYLDRFSYNRYQRKAGELGQKGAAKKR
ncbi:MAG TPA: hypothetical protein VKB43_06490 [Gaiellaceae bacterium]|nr:hypothetical protein [Gaiellaceae bacterium]